MRIYKKKCIQRHFPKERKMKRKIKIKLIGEAAAVVIAVHRIWWRRTRSRGGRVVVAAARRRGGCRARSAYQVV
jgi:hypothetical protein